MIKVRIRRDCPICGETDREVAHHNPLARIDDCDLGYDVVSCTRCAFSYADKLAQVQVYRRYYSRFSKYDTIAKVEDIPLLNRQMALNAAGFLRPHVPYNAAILDIGCSVGLLLGTLKQLGYHHLSGLDPSPSSTTLAQSLFGVKVLNGFLDRGTDLSTFDVVILSAVLEHLNDFNLTFSAAANRLKQGAMVYVEVPAADRFGKLGDSEPYGEFSLEHVNFFSAASLNNYFSFLGFRTIAQRYVHYVNGSWGLMMLFCKEKGTSREAPVRDESLRRSLETYIKCSSRRMQDVNRILSSYAGTPVIVYGAGSHTARLLRQSSLPGCRILFIVDRNRNLHGATLDGLTIHDPNLLAKFPSIPVIVSSYFSEAEIAATLSQISKNPIVLLYGKSNVFARSAYFSS